MSDEKMTMKERELIESLLKSGMQLSTWCCMLSGDRTYDAVRCWNEVWTDAQAMLRESAPV